MLLFAVAACWLTGWLRAKGLHGFLAAAAAILHAASRLQCMRCIKLHMFLQCVFVSSQCVLQLAAKDVQCSINRCRLLMLTCSMLRSPEV
jgi:hypothetical protein